MRKVVRLTESDIERLVQKIILEEQKFYNRKKITENVRQLITNQELEGEELDEGAKEWAFAALAFLAGAFSLKGQEQQKQQLTKLAQERLDKVKKVRSDILSHKEDAAEFVDFINKAAEKNPNVKKIQNPNEFIKNLEKNTDKNLEILELDVEKNPERGGVKERLATDIKIYKLEAPGDFRAVQTLVNERGYSIKDFREVVDTVYKTTPKEKDSIITFLPYKVSLNLNDIVNMFPSGGYEINKNALTDIEGKIGSFVDTLKMVNASLTKLNLESSTDAQGLSPDLQKKLKADGYTSDNEGLANARADALKNVIMKVFKEKGFVVPNNLDVNLKIKPEQGGLKKQVYSEKEKQQQQWARNVKGDAEAIVIVKSKIPVQPEGKKEYSIVKKQVVELVKARIAKKTKGGGGGNWRPGDGPGGSCGVDGCEYFD